MSTVSISQLKTYWKSVSDWVTGVDAVSSARVQLTGRKGEVKFVSLSDVTTVAPAGSSILSTTVPSGKRWTILEWMYEADAPSGAASGTHTASFYIYNASLLIAKVTTDYNKNVHYTFNQFYNGAAGAYLANVVPDDKAAQQQLLKGTQLQNGIDLKASYTNNTNVTQTGTRYLMLLVLEEVLTA